MRSSAQNMTVCIVVLIGGVAFSVDANDLLCDTPLQYAFVTSVSGSANLQTWPDADGLSGVDAADAICQERARLAGLPNPTLFVAWISDSADDAYCRIHGLSGKTSDNCGLSSLPTGAGPWLRTDGSPFGSTIGEMVYPGGRIYRPMEINEYGVAIGTASYFTGSQRDGAWDEDWSCLDWTAAINDWATLGFTTSTADQWSSGGSAKCDGPTRRLLCLEAGAGRPLPPFWEPGARVFVSSLRWNGNLGGLVGADAKCSSMALAAGLPAPNSFKALLSTTAVDAADRFTHDGPFVRIDGIKVAVDLVDLFDTSLTAPINVTEYGDYIGNHAAWTGSESDGTSSGIDCSGWLTSNPAGSGSYGGVNESDSMWISNPSPLPCGPSAFHIYCVSEASVDILSDGFESCTTASWTLIGGP